MDYFRKGQVGGEPAQRRMKYDDSTDSRAIRPEPEPLPEKRIRAGTRSCACCRRRKVKCVFTSASDTSCTACVRSRLECVAQGVVENNDDWYNHYHHRKLQERIDRLQSLVVQLMPEKELEDLLPGFRDAATPAQEGRSSDAVATPGQESCSWPSGGAVEHAESAGGRHVPPLMRSPVLSREHDVQHEPEPLHTPELLPIDGQDDSSLGTVEQSGKKYEQVTTELRQALPSQDEMAEMFTHRSSWWGLWLNTLGLVWGGPDFEDFVTNALSKNHPCLIGTSLVGFAICSGDLQRYLSLVEKQILNDDHLGGTTHGLSF